jgi:hypothetical protein
MYRRKHVLFVKCLVLYIFEAWKEGRKCNKIQVLHYRALQGTVHVMVL